MDRDQARIFVKQVLKSETDFLEDLKDYQEKMESVEDWESVSRDFAPRVKAFYNAQLEQWQRYYLGLDSGTNKYGFSVMHTAQKKDRVSTQATIPHSVFGELKQKMKVGGTNAKLSATGGKAAREIIEKKLGQRVTEIETKGKGGTIGGGLDAAYDAEQAKNAPLPPTGSKPKEVEESKETPKEAPKDTPKDAPKAKKLTPAQLKFGVGPESEPKPDEQLSSILQRRNDLYGAGKW